MLFTVFLMPGAEIYSDIYNDFSGVIQHAINLLVRISEGLMPRPILHLVLVAVSHTFILPGLVSGRGMRWVCPSCSGTMLSSVR